MQGGQNMVDRRNMQKKPVGDHRDRTRADPGEESGPVYRVYRGRKNPKK